MIEQFKELTINRNNNFYLDSYDYQILYMLYKPLVGPNCIDFYLSLYQLSLFSNPITKNIICITDIISDNDISNKEMDSFIKHLKCIKLLNIKDDKITLYPNYPPNDFFNLPLGYFLKNVTSKSHYDSLLKRFEADDGKQEDLLTTSLQSLDKVLDYHKRKNDLIPFSFDDFKNNLSISDKSEIDKNKDFFIGVSQVFNLSLETMMNIFYEVENDSIFDRDEFLKLAYTKYQNNLLKVERIKRNKSDKHILEFISECSAEELMHLKARNILSKADKLSLDKLRNEYKLKEELISLLVGYSLATNDYKMHAFVFYEKVLNDWKDKNIETLEDAYYYICSLYDKEKKNNIKINKTKDYFADTKSMEDMFNDMWKELREKKQ